MSIPANLVGREREQARLRACLTAAVAGQGSLVLVSGEAGIGKTALVDWLAREARAGGARVTQGGCYDLSITPPYGPWIEALALLGPAHPLRRTPGGEVEGSQTLLFQQVCDLLARECAARPLVLVLEDVHWSDPASLELLRFIARGVEALGLLLVATYRAEEPARGALFPLLPLLVREGRAVRIDLCPLDAAAVLALVGDRYPVTRREAERLAAYVRARSDGNPFYLHEILRTLELERLLVPAHDGWWIGDLASAPVPPLVRQVVEGRLAHLDEVSRDLLELAAVIGQDVPLELWRALAGAEHEFPVWAPRGAVRAQLLVEAPDGASLSFSHALVRETLYFGQARERRVELHRRLAELLATRPDPAPELVASHFAQADDPRAIDWFTLAGERALALYAARDAVVALTRAQELAVRHRRVLDSGVYRTRAAAHALLGEFDQARGDQETVLGRARVDDDRQGEWQALVDLGMLWAERDYERTGGYYRAALDLARGLADQALIAHSLNRIANWHVNLDEPERALPLHQEALAIFEARDDQIGIADTLDFLGMTSFLGCDNAASLCYYERALALSRASDDRQRVYSCLVAMQLLGGEQDTGVAAPVYREPGFWVRCGDEALEIARAMGWAAGEAFALTMRSFVITLRGQLGPALADAEAALVLAEQVGHRQWATAAKLALGIAWAALHQPERAAAAMEQALGEARQIGSGFWFNSISAGLASLRIEHGELAHAAALLESAGSPERLGASSGQRQCRYARAELALARREPELALALIDCLLETRPHPEADHGIPALTKLRGDALAQLGRPADAAREYAAAREGALLFDYRSLLWRVDAAWGALHLAEGRVSDAEASFGNARATIAAIAATIDDSVLRAHYQAEALARLPVLPERDAGLSPRELDVLRLLAEGQSDREIAEALSISPRTVMRHVTGIFNKLGVGSRTAAASIAIRQRIV